MRTILIATFGESTADDALRTALPLIAVTALGAGGTLLGILNALPFLWYLFAHRQIGSAVDALGYRRAVALGNGSRILVVGTLAALHATNNLTVTTLVALTAAVGLGDALFTTGHSAMVPATVGTERTAECYRRIESVRAIARVFGPALTSWLLRVAGQPVVLGASSVAYLVSMISLSALPRDAQAAGGETSIGASPTSEAEDAAAAKEPGPTDTQWTVREVLATRGLAHLTLATAVLNGAAMLSGTALVLFALESLGLRPATVAVFAAAGALGAVVGAACAKPLRVQFSTGTARLLATAGVAASSLVAPAALLAPWGQAWVVGGGEFLIALCATASAVVGSDVPARLIPQSHLGRAFAAIRLLTIGVMPVASILGGALITATTPATALLASAGVASLACLPLLRIRNWSPPGARTAH